MKAILGLIRIKNLVIIILTQYFIRFFLIRPFYKLNGFELAMPEYAFVLMVLATLFITAAGYIVNDYFDVEIDKINKPGKNIIGDGISVPVARMLYFLLNLAAAAIGVWLAYKIKVFQLDLLWLLIILMLWSYSKKYKRQLLYGNFVVAVMSAFAIYIVWMFEFFWLRQGASQFVEMAGTLKTINVFVLGLTFFAFFVSLIREVVKDMEDVEGDKAGNCRTLPLVVGTRRSRQITAGLMFVLIVATVFGQRYLWMYNFDYLFWYFCIIIQPLFIYVFYKILNAEKKNDFHFISNALKIIMFAGIVSLQLLQLNF